MIKIAVSNQKGGVGKTTTAVNLAAGLGILGKKVLLIDMDPQCNATTGVSMKHSIKTGLYEVITGDVTSIKYAIYKSKFKNLYVIPSNISLSGLDIKLSQMKGRELILKDKIQEIENEYDYIILDCPPSLGTLTLNALSSADTVLIPIQAEYYALEGVTQLLNTIRVTQKYLNHSLKLEGLLLTMVLKTNFSKEIENDVRKSFKNLVFKTTISRGVKISESPSHGKPIYYYEPKCKGSLEYLQFAQEVINRGEKK